jgi:hypothetical protein
MVTQVYPYTYADAVDAMCIYLGNAAGADNAVVRRAIQHAYRDLMARRDWQYTYGQAVIELQPPFNDGTVAYTNSTRTVTLTTTDAGVFPSWSYPYGRLAMADVNGNYTVFPVIGNPTSTTLLLGPNSNPGADIPSGNAYNLYQSVYPVPPDFKAFTQPTTFVTWASEYIAPEDWYWLEWHGQAAGNPVRWTILPDPHLIGAYCVAVQPWPSVAQPLGFVYQRLMRRMVYCGYETASRQGAVSVSGTAVTGVGTAFNSAMVGSYLRLSPSATVPTGDGDLNPFTEELKIASVTSGTALVLDVGAQNTYSGVGYVITDPVDLPDILMDAFLWGCRFQYSALSRADQREDDFKYYIAALRTAFENDAPARLTERRVGRTYKYADRGWFSPSNPSYAYSSP